MKKWANLLVTTLSTAGLLLGSSGFSATTVHAATADNTLTDADINAYISRMTLEEKVGQMFISRTPQDNQQVRQDVAKYHLGGLIVYGADFTSVKDAAAFKTKMQSFQDAADLPLLVGIDQEGGKVSRLSDNPVVSDYRAFPSPQQAYAEGGMPEVLKEATDVGAMLRDLGVNWNFAPDADTTSDKDAFIYARSFGQDYATTADYITQVVPAWQQNVAATLKHFPGYGAAIDTHTDFAVVDRTKEQFEQEDLLPFKAGIEAGVDSIMIAHIVMKAVDPDYPSSLSRKVVQGLLREELGFQGVIITDGLGMGAITKFAQEHNDVAVDVLAAEAGNDGIMNNDYAKAIPALLDAVKAGNLSESEINQHVFRLLSLKRKLGLITKADLAKKEITSDKVTYDQDAKVARITGTVVDPDLSTGEPIYAKSVDGAPLAETVIGAGGKYEIDVPLTDAKQAVVLSTGMTDIAPLSLTIDALAKAETPVDTTPTPTDTGKQDAKDNQGKPQPKPVKTPAKSAKNTGHKVVATAAKKNTKASLPRTGDAKEAALAGLGFMAIIAAVGGAFLLKKHAA